MLTLRRVDGRHAETAQEQVARQREDIYVEGDESNGSIVGNVVMRKARADVCAWCQLCRGSRRSLPFDSRNEGVLQAGSGVDPEI